MRLDQNRPGKPGYPPRPPRVTHGGSVAFKARLAGNDQGIVKNVSESGALLYASSRYAAGTELVVYLPLDFGRRKSLCMVSGKIVRVVDGGDPKRANAYGVQFDTGLSASSRQLLRDFVALKSGGTPPERSAPKFGRRVSPYKD